MAFAREANTNPVDYALATGQLERIHWPGLTDHELRYCHLPPTETEFCVLASAEMEARVTRLIEAGLTFAVVNTSVFFPRLVDCGHASDALKQRVEVASLPVLLAALDDFEMHGLAAAILRNSWKGKGNYNASILSAEERLKAQREETLEAVIKSGSFEPPVFFEEHHREGWENYIKTRDLSSVDLATLISLTAGGWWRMRALRELVDKAPLELWLQSPLHESYNSLVGEMRASLMRGLHRKLVMFVEVRKFLPLFSLSFLDETELKEIQDHALKLCRTPDDVAFLKSHYSLSDKQSMEALLQIQRRLEK